jgi:Putative prokaryotic signal transducing protein
VSNHEEDNDLKHPRLVELTRVQPVEAEIIAARLRAAGIDATLVSGSVYESISFADGVPILVPEDEVAAASAILSSDGQESDT